MMSLGKMSVNKWTKIVFCHTDNVHLALGIFRGIRRMGRIDHHRLTEPTPNCPKGGLGRIGWSKDLPDPARRVNSLVDKRDAFRAARQLALLRDALAGTSAGWRKHSGSG
jgi:hypothetical protein